MPGMGKCGELPPRRVAASQTAAGPAASRAVRTAFALGFGREAGVEEPVHDREVDPMASIFWAGATGPPARGVPAPIACHR